MKNILLLVLRIILLWILLPLFVIMTLMVVWPDEIFLNTNHSAINQPEQFDYDLNSLTRNIEPVYLPEQFN